MMKYFFISFLFLAGTTSVVLAQSEVKENYFHELKAMEDSSGVTHLFYRHLKESEYFCDQDGYDRYLKSERNDIYHYDTSVKSDSIFFRDSFSEWCIEGGMSQGHHINSYIFLNNDLKKWIRGETYISSDPNSALVAYNSFENSNSENDNYISTFFDAPQKLLLAGNSDSILVGLGSYLNTTVVLPSDSKKWPDFIEVNDKIPDSLFIDRNILAVSPFSDSVYFATGSQFESPYLYKSTNYGKSYTLVDTLYSWDFDDQLHFDKDSSHIYALAPSGVAISNKFGEPDSWELRELDYAFDGRKYLATDISNSDHLFVSDSTRILFSDDYGENFSLFYNAENEITGLYKKPNSDLLYVLTKEELLEVNTETKETTSLKKLPVSSEPEPSEIPTQITLQQNYPNPFNPTTVISYQLPENTLVRLEVFDLTGRKVAVLVNGERQTARTHRVNFDASGLASGIYFYRLTTSGQTLTRKMLLIK